MKKKYLVFSGEVQGGAPTIIAGALAFAFQIYCDFSGYTDIARGVSKLLGFELMLNFKLPYLAKNPSDFWNRWHIELLDDGKFVKEFDLCVNHQVRFHLFESHDSTEIWIPSVSFRFCISWFWFLRGL